MRNSFDGITFIKCPYKIEINTQYHDVTVLARKNYPSVLVDGVHLHGVVSAKYMKGEGLSNCAVVLTFDEGVEENAFPYNDIDVSVRDIVFEMQRDDEEYEESLLPSHRLRKKEGLVLSVAMR